MCRFLISLALMEMGKELPLELLVEMKVHLTPKWTSRSSRSRAMRKIKNVCTTLARPSLVKTGIWITWKSSMFGKRMKNKRQRNNRQASKSRIRQTRLTKRAKSRTHSRRTQNNEQTWLLLRNRKRLRWERQQTHTQNISTTVWPFKVFIQFLHSMGPRPSLKIRTRKDKTKKYKTRLFDLIFFKRLTSLIFMPSLFILVIVTVKILGATLLGKINLRITVLIEPDFSMLPLWDTKRVALWMNI